MLPRRFEKSSSRLKETYLIVNKLFLFSHLEHNFQLDNVGSLENFEYLREAWAMSKTHIGIISGLANVSAFRAME